MVKTVKLNKKSFYFDRHITLRVSKDMCSLIDNFINLPSNIDSNGLPLYKNRSHFIKCCIIDKLKTTST